MRSHLDGGERTKSIRRWGATVMVIATVWALGGGRVTGQTPAARGSTQQASTTPRTPWGHPDLSGSWDRNTTAFGSGPLRPAKTQADGKSICISDCPEPEKPAASSARTGGESAPRVGPARPKYKTEFQAKVKMLDERQIYEDPAFHCMPPGVPRIGPPPRILQTATDVIFLYDDLSGNFFRFIPIDGRPRRTDTDPSYLGDAVGHWEADTLIVETTNFNSDSWLIDDGAFHTDKLRVVEKVRRVGDTLEWEATAYDPDVLAEPFTMTRRLAKSSYEIAEAPPCVERSGKKMLDLSNHDNNR
jgi:hypothetical protein